MEKPSFVESREPRPNEVGVAFVFLFDPRSLNKFRNDSSPKRYEQMVADLVDQQFGLGRDRIVGALKGYVEEQQALIDATV